QPVQGGEIRFEELLFNAALSQTFSNHMSWYLSYSEGFIVPDVGAQLRATDANFNTDDSQLRGLKTKTYEIGLRQSTAAGRWSVSGYHSRSDLNMELEEFVLKTYDKPERILGVDVESELPIADAWVFRQGFNWAEGR